MTAPASAHANKRSARPLWQIVAIRVALFALLAALAQLGVVFADYYGNDEELARLLVERQTAELAEGIGVDDGVLSYRLPEELKDIYQGGAGGYFARVRTGEGQVLFSACNETCTEHFLPLTVRLPDFWMRLLAEGKPLTLAGGATMAVENEAVLIEMATLGDPRGLVWGVLWHEVIDHMIVPMSLILIFVVGGTLISIAAALRPVRAAAIRAEALDPMDSGSHLDSAGMPLEVAQLAGAVNRAFARVGDLIAGQKLLTSAIAHEVRTPLSIIKLELERIDHPRARKAEDDLDELNDFVSQLTALARLEAADLSGTAPADLVALSRDLIEGMAPWVYEQRHAIVFRDQGPLEVPAIAHLLRDAIRNLIENAVKHTPEGTTVSVTVDASGLIEVADNGGGYDARDEGEDLSRLITPAGGLGIGLEIVRRIAALHDAEMRQERTKQGMRMTLVFANVPAQAGA